MFFFFFITTSAIGQSLDKKYIDNWISKTFLNSFIDSQTIYILNGHLIDKEKIDNELSKYKESDITIIDFVDKVTNDSLITCQHSSGVVLLGTKGKQIKKSINENFALAKSKFKKNSNKTIDDTSSSEPALLINGVPINQMDCFDTINELKASHIIGINIIDRPVSQDIYGTNAKYGLIMITKK